ncbi:hypothetical protein HG530_002542 [Fusarium avenaceum]|nr:hypothetical protein HG530_002542 [Fusarium avenaceum]
MSGSGHLALRDICGPGGQKSGHKSRHNVILLNTLEPYSNLVTTLSQLHLVFLLTIDGSSFNGLLVGHHNHAHTLLDNTGLNLALHHCAEITVLPVDGQHEGGVDLTLECLHAVEVLKQGGALPPGSNILGDAGLDAHHLLSSNGQEVDVVLEVVASALKELSELGCTLLVSLMRPGDGRVVHLVDSNDELVDTLSLGKHSVLTGLSATLKTSLVFTLSG